MKYLIIILIFCITSCSYSRQSTEAVRNFSMCYDNKYTGLDTLINCSGYYYSKPLPYLLKDITKITPRDTINESFIFYKDGFFVKDFSSIYYFQTPENLKKYKDYNGGNWGLYTLCGDTIKARFVNTPGTMSFANGEWWFKIVDRNTIQLLGFKYWKKLTIEEIKEKQSENNDEDNAICRFAPLNVMPNPNNSWIKKEHWFWCNKEKFKVWKHQRKKQ